MWIWLRKRIYNVIEEYFLLNGDKLIDDYYARKLAHQIQQRLILLSVNTRVEMDTNIGEVTIYAKRRRYNEDCWRQICRFHVSEAIEQLIGFEDLYNKQFCDNVWKITGLE